MKTYQLLLLSLFFPGSLLAQDHAFTITGKIGTANSPAIVYLAYKKDGKNVADSASIINGAFTIKGRTIDPFYATLVLDHQGKGLHNLNPRGKNDLLKLIVDKGAIKISSPDSACHATVEGSVAHSDNQRLNELLKQANDEAGKQSIRKSFIENNPNSYASISALWIYAGDFANAHDLQILYASLSQSVQQTEVGRQFQKALDNLILLKAGMPAPEFVQADTTGKSVSLSSFRGKYVLVDFWASWCGPCREENPALVRVYEKYSHKNFSILGVSLDKFGQQKAWIDAINKDKLPWQHVSDLKGWDNEAAKLYSVRFIPQNFLVAPDGKIVAVKLSTKDLDKMLEKLLSP